MLGPGSRLGKYSIIRPIGTGGFATVYLGEHIYLRTMAAVKVLYLGSNMEQREVDKFLREAQTIAALKHPHIVSILDFGVEDGIPCLIMEYAPNGSLATLYKKNTIVDKRDILSYTMQIAEALQFAHDHKVVHCDIKPGNMLLDKNNNVLLSDFGIAVVMHTNFKMSTVMGTVHYMSPEQYLGQPVAASDQYSLAVVVYRWLCGQFPFGGQSLQEIWDRQMNVSPRPLRQVNPQISRRVEQVVLTALARDPHQRFASVSDFASALERAMQPQRPVSLPIQPAPLPVREKSATPREVLTLLPSITSLLPLADRKNVQAQPSSVPPTQAQSVEDLPKINNNQQEVQHPPSNRAMSQLEKSYQSPFALPSISQISKSIPTTYLSYAQHTTWVSAVAWSPDGTKLASASWDKTVHIWDATNYKTLLVYRGHTQPVKGVAWSPDGVYIASGAWDNSVQVWETANGIALPETYQHKAQIETVAWSPDGIYIASAGQDSQVRVWRAADQYTFLTYKGHTGPVWSVAWSPHDKYIASASHDGTVQVWKALTGELVQTYRNHEHPVAAVSWSYDGQLIASGDHDGWVHVWSSTDGNMLLQYRDQAGAVKALDWSPVSMYLASAVKSIQIWHVTAPPPTTPGFTYIDHTDWVNALSWSPAGDRIATAGDDKSVQIKDWQR